MPWLVVPVLLLSLFGGGAIVVNAADEAVPGQVLYGLDTAFEGLRFSLTSDEGDKVRLSMGRAEERLEEVERMVASGYGEVSVEAAVAGYVTQLREAVQTMERFQLHAGDPSGSDLGQEFKAQLRAQERLLLQLQTRAQVREIGELFTDARARVQAQNRLQGMERATPRDQSGDSPGHPSGNERANQGPWSEMPPAEAGPQEEWQAALSRVQLRYQEMQNLMAEGDRLGLEERLRLHLQQVEALRQLARQRSGEDPQASAQMSAELDQALVGGMTAMTDLLPNAPEWARELLQQALQSCQSEHLELQALMRSGDGTRNEAAGQGGESQTTEVPLGQNAGQPGQCGGERGAGPGSGGPHSDGNQGSGGGH